jgi:hypothetical protein
MAVLNTNYGPCNFFFCTLNVKTNSVDRRGFHTLQNDILFVFTVNPGRIGTVVNDRLRRKTEIYGDRTRTPHTGTVYDVKRSETDSVYGDRVKIRSD